MARRHEEEVINRSEKAWELKRQWFGILTEAYRYAMPGQNPFAGTDPTIRRTGGFQHYKDIYDSTAYTSLQRLVNRIHVEMFPRGQNWADIQVGRAFVGSHADEIGYMDELQHYKSIIFQQIHASNFGSTIPMFLMDWACGGTGVMKVDRRMTDGPSRLNFEAISQSEVAMEAGPGDRIWGVYRKVLMTREEMMRYWPDAIMAKLPEPDDDEKNPATYTVHEATYYDMEQRMWWYDVIFRNDDSTDDHGRFVERVYTDSPWIIARWMVEPGEVQGISPVMIALPDIRTVNKAVELLLKNATMKMSGMFLYSHNGVVNPSAIRMGPGVWIAARSATGPTASVAPLPVGGDLHMSQIVIEDFRNSIRKILLDEGLPEETSAVRSATEVVERLKQLQMDLGAPFNRIVDEIGIPVLQRVVNILTSQHLIAPINEGHGGLSRSLRLDGDEVMVEFTGPMAISQRLVDVQQIAKFLEVMQMAGPEATHMGVKMENVGATIGRLMGIPAELIRPSQERMELAQNMMNIAQQQQAQQQGAAQ